MEQKETILEKLGRILSMAGNAIMMNLLFLLSCLPVVTMGAAWNALFSAIRYNVRGEKWFEGFKFGFKIRFWRSLLGWTLMLVLNAITILDFTAYLMVDAYSVEGVVRLVASGVMMLLSTGFTGALILLNVYVPTSVSNWLRNAVNLVFKAPLQLALVGALMWFPLLLAMLAYEFFYYFVMVFVVAYFVLAALGITMLMKQPLLDCLIEARTEGILTSEEGKQKPQADEEERSQE